jgi:hypothetical protein
LKADTTQYLNTTSQQRPDRAANHGRQMAAFNSTSSPADPGYPVPAPPTQVLSRNYYRNCYPQVGRCI